MDNLKDIRFEFSEKYIRLYANCAEPYRRISFIFSVEEFTGFVTKYDTHLSDIGHHIMVFGDICMIYDLSFPRKDSGTLEVSYQKFTFPRQVRKMILRLRNKVINSGIDLNKQEYSFSISEKTAKRFLKMYGQGTGSVEIEVAENARAKYESSIGTDDFDKNIEYLVSMAKNSTYSWRHVEKVFLGNDFAGFTFSVNGLFGGLIRHQNNDGTHHWSLHT